MIQTSIMDTEACPSHRQATSTTADTLASSSSSSIFNKEENIARSFILKDFFERIGSPRLIVAPMVDHSDLAFRMLTRRYGAQLTYTQMFNSNMFVQSEDYRADNFRTCELDRPLIVQFAGHEPVREMPNIINHLIQPKYS
jgi:tRNA-dihydrouridine synthase 1